MSRLLRRAFPLHRALGLTTAALVLLWTLSGATMLFHGHPYPDAASDRRAARPMSTAALPDRWPDVIDGARELRLEDLGEGPSFERVGFDGSVVVLDRDGARRPRFSRAEARIIAGCRASATDVLDDPDRFTFARSLASSFPLARVECEDPSGTVRYVSLPRRRLVFATTRAERSWAWLGSIPHWLYAESLRRHRDAWEWAVEATSALALLGASAGLIAGIRLGRRRAIARLRNVSRRRHVVLGIAASAPLVLWLVSGFLSVNPLGLAPRTEVPSALLERMHRLDASTRRLTPRELVDRCSSVCASDGVALVRLGRREFARCLRRGAGDVYVDAMTGERLGPAIPRADLVDAIETAIEPRIAHRIGPVPKDDPYVASTRDRVRVDLSDARDTTYYLDARRATIVAAFDDSSRRTRWIFDALHTWNVGPLERATTLRRIIQVIGLGTIVLVVGLGLAARMARSRTRRAS